MTTKEMDEKDIQIRIRKISNGYLLLGNLPECVNGPVYFSEINPLLTAIERSINGEGKQSNE